MLFPWLLPRYLITSNGYLRGRCSAKQTQTKDSKSVNIAALQPFHYPCPTLFLPEHHHGVDSLEMIAKLLQGWTSRVHRFLVHYSGANLRLQNTTSVKLTIMSDLGREKASSARYISVFFAMQGVQSSVVGAKDLLRGERGWSSRYVNIKQKPFC